MFSVQLSYDIVSSEESPAEKTDAYLHPLIRELAAIESEKSLQKAAKRIGVSYRYFWGQIEAWEKKFGQTLVIREQGRPAKLSALGEKLLWAERSVLARHAVELEKVRTELSSALAAASDPSADIITLAGCFDSWLSTLPTRLFPKGVILDLQFSTSVLGLKSLANGECSIAGFNFPRAFEGDAGPSSASKTFAPLIDPGRSAMCRFASRMQGLAVAKGNPLEIHSMKDVAGKSLRYVGRGEGTGTTVLLTDLCRKEGVSREEIRQTTRAASHNEAATCVAAGQADAGLCVETAARSAGADFVPLAEEDYFLIWRKDAEPAPLEKLLGLLRSPQWRASAFAFPGVSAAHCGELMDPASLGWWR